MFYWPISTLLGRPYIFDEYFMVFNIMALLLLLWLYENFSPLKYIAFDFDSP